jgi:ribonuclease P protein component
MRFRTEQHLRRQTEIRAVREKGERLECRSFTAWCHRRPPVDESGAARLPRLVIAASIAAVGPAVQRNRAKRRLREIFRRHQDLLPAGCDLLLVARAAVNRRPFAELDQVFVDACGKINRSATGTK